jgi:hypothetical protein
LNGAVADYGVLLLQCYIDNVCRADARDKLGTPGFNAVAQQSDLHYEDNRCRKCDADASTSAWTEYARGARCQLCADVGASDTVEYDVKPGWCVIDDNVIPNSIIGLPGSKQEHSSKTLPTAGGLPATTPHSDYQGATYRGFRGLT